MTPKASLIISVYDNIPFLKLVLDSLQWQTEQDFEVIVSEDAEHEDMARFVASYPFLQSHQHLTQPDTGWRKELALNRAVVAAKSDWLVFIDGNCLLHPRFMEEHIRMAAPDVVLAGKRVRLPQLLTERLLTNQMDVRDVPRALFRQLFTGRVSHIEEALYVSSESLPGRLFPTRKAHSLTGCNMSVSRHALRLINGFDEDYTRPAIGEDVDLLWRLRGMGVRLASVRNRAVQYHLWHSASWTDQSENQALMRQHQAENQYICKNGIQKL